MESFLLSPLVEELLAYLPFLCPGPLYFTPIYNISSTKRDNQELSISEI